MADNELDDSKDNVKKCQFQFLLEREGSRIGFKILVQALTVKVRFSHEAITASASFRFHSTLVVDRQLCPVIQQVESTHFPSKKIEIENWLQGLECAVNKD